MSKALNAFPSVIHSHSTSPLLGVLINLHNLLLPCPLGPEDYLEGALLVSGEVGGSVLVPEGMSADADGLGPGGDQFGDVGTEDGFTEDGPV